MRSRGRRYLFYMSRFASLSPKWGDLLLVLGLSAIFSGLLGVSTASAQGLGFDFNPYNFNNVVIGGGGGFIPGIVFSTKEPGLVYARTDIGGAYRFDTHEGRWIPLLDWVGFPDWNLSGVESIAIDPVDPHRLYLAVGTYTNDYTTENGAILRSFDKGRRFQTIHLPFKVGSNMPGRGMGERLAIDPNNTRILYLGTRSGNGLWRSMDSGETWAKVTNFPDTGPYHEPAYGPTDTYDLDPIGVVWETFDPRTTVDCGRQEGVEEYLCGGGGPGEQPVAKQRWRANLVGGCWAADRRNATPRQARVYGDSLPELQQQCRTL
jgi:xyloglucan-specific exo-beta-1,4-glucanase